jgi:hypothetical protein
MSVRDTYYVQLTLSIGATYMRDEKRTAVFQVRMRPTVKAAGEKAAADDNRSLAALMETLLVEHLKAKGYLPK